MVADSRAGQIAEGIAEKIREALPELRVSVEFDAAILRKQLPDAGRVIIVPRSEKMTAVLRADCDCRMLINIGVLLPLREATFEAIDAGLKIVDDLKALWGNEGALRDEEIAGADWMELTQQQLYSPAALQEQQQFTSIFTVDYFFNR